MQFLNRVLTGDCRSLLPRLPTSSVDFILTDPPYLVNYRSRDGRRLVGDRDGAWLAPVSAELYRVLKPNRLFVSFYGWQAADQFLAAWRAAGFRPVGHLVWTKRYASSERYLRYQHEQAYLLAKGYPPRPQRPLPDVLPWKYTGNTLHPTQKPLSALTPIIAAFSRRHDIVLDPFCGSGSTLLAAKLCGRQYLGIEIDPQYAEIADGRLYQERLDRSRPSGYASLTINP